MNTNDEQNNDAVRTGADRIRVIMQAYNMNNIQFAQATGIPMASISHLLSGRNNPTHQIYEKIVTAFPDLNPSWVGFGKGEMYLETSNEGSETEDEASQSDVSFSLSTHKGTSDSSSVPTRKGTLDLSAQTLLKEERPAQVPTPRAGRSADSNNQQDPFASLNMAALVHPAGAQTPSPSVPQEQPPILLEPGMVKELVKETIAALKRPTRRIQEVRIFFDDGTYESFGGPK